MFALASRSFVFGLAAVLLAACSADTRTLQSAGTCVEGQSERCTCDDGTPGVRECGSDNEFDRCECGSAGSGGAPGSGGAGGVAGSPVGGSSGSGGFAAVGGGDPAAGSGGGAGISGAGGVGAGAGGMTGGIEATGGVGMAGIGGMTGGMGETGGASGVEAGTGGPGHDPLPGELYGACRDDGSCDAGLLCVNDSSGGLAESYCTTTCDAFTGMPCPRQRGDGMAACVLGICVR